MPLVSVNASHTLAGRRAVGCGDPTARKRVTLTLTLSRPFASLRAGSGEGGEWQIQRVAERAGLALQESDPGLFKRLNLQTVFTHFGKMIYALLYIVAEIQVLQLYFLLDLIVYKLKKLCLVGPKSNFVFFGKIRGIGREAATVAGSEGFILAGSKFPEMAGQAQVFESEGEKLVLLGAGT